MSVETFVAAAETLFTLETMAWVVMGVLLGIVVGALPGLGPPLGMAIILPLTLPMEPTNAIILLIGVYSGSMYGGSIAAILINTPGVSSSAATMFDGYPMSKQGRAATALSISATASAIAGALTIVVLLLFSPFLVEVVLAVGTPERFLVAILGLAMITVVARGSIVKGLLAGVAGLLVTTVGSAPMSLDNRYTDSMLLYDGVSFVAVLIGLFAIAEMMKLAGQEGGIAEDGVRIGGGVSAGIVSTLKRPITVVKSGFLGMVIGSIPGAGATVSNFIAYSEAVRSSDDPDSFGDGNETGVVASEASNNGTVAGSLVPAISFGIPGSSSTAVLIGGLLMHDLRPGQSMFDPSGELALTYAMLLALLLGNLVILLVGLSLVTRLGILTKIDTNYIIPMVIVLSFLGTFALDTNPIDVLTIIVFGVLGFYMVRHNYSVIAFVLGVVLGDIAEQNLYRSLELSDGSYMIFVNPFEYGWLSPLLVLVICLILVGPFLQGRLERYRDG
ncbi:tripartite tricarboxylate transporter permease [Natronolimnohabitans sp. A-GB9]|uniref:tripartite tricarboxylate transporter permease n=1 Tax=Natronolimnohabitans sp. A-GB9 TaxID=3069757 RepID=UPI0027AF0B16|nr:tripartite tricarboxylate transporter permease [Natronolimnohabitans sp. A-GB9]MDQ2049578.1 tripartite tricarboxylate transporter permease [Natronolimnohabitans sp. A-GB9]